jgi:class 3 adenylate cyclase
MNDSRRQGALVPELRVGIHAGEAVAEDNDLVGRVINLAARVTDAAEPGEILITEPVADHLSPGVPLVDRGLRPLKGFAQPRHLLAVAWQPTDETIVLTSELEDDAR